METKKTAPQGRSNLQSLLTLLVCMAFAPAVEAQSAAGPEDAVDTTTFNFDDDLVTGDLVRPDGERLMARRSGVKNTLVTIREHFIPEMLKSIEDL